MTQVILIWSTNPRYQFWLIVRSDGAVVDFIFGRSKHTKVLEKTMIDIDMDPARDHV